MDVDIPESFPHELVMLNEVNYFIILCSQCHGELSEKSKNLFSISQIATRQFTYYKGMTNHIAVSQQCLQTAHS